MFRFSRIKDGECRPLPENVGCPTGVHEGNRGVEVLFRAS